MTTLAEAMQELEGMESIPRVLGELGIKGLKGKSRQCPLARYFEAQIGQPVAVGITKVWSRDLLQTTGLTPRVRSFQSAFDRGQYPALDEEGDS